MTLTGDGAAIVGGQEEGQTHDLDGDKMALERLVREDFGAVLGSYPEPALLFREDRPRKDGVDADVIFSDLVGRPWP